ncbi:MAG: tetraacyldisaccharide 4'-kinase [Gammaproteobacteria bacterium]
MKAAQLQDEWYGGRPPGALLHALAGVYASVAAARRERARPDPALLGRPIVVVGNITVGGTGKTPLVIRLCELLAARGHHPAVISRGYGREGRDPLRVGATTPARDGGDEPVLIARRTGVPVFVDADREAAAQRAFDEGADVVVADDGLQRRTLPRAVEICVVDGARGLGNGLLLPAGPLREPPERLQDTEFVVVNGEPAPKLGARLRDAPVMRLEPTGFRSLDGQRRLAVDEMLEHCRGRSVTALAGIGHPERFFGTLDALRVPAAHRRPFADHHAFAPGDFEDVEGVVLMTEKDAVKCRSLWEQGCPALEDAWFLQVDAVLPERWENELIERIERAIAGATQ